MRRSAPAAEASAIPRRMSRASVESSEEGMRDLSRQNAERGAARRSLDAMAMGTIVMLAHSSGGRSERHLVPRTYGRRKPTSPPGDHLHHLLAIGLEC
jgi:hypothetical protein